MSLGYFKEENKNCLETIRGFDLLEEERVLSSDERLEREACRKEYQILALKEELY